jgi:membrane AbrB-like protein
MRPKNSWADFARTFAFATLGGGLFSLTFIPLPWILGPMTGVLVWQNLMRQRSYWPLSFRNMGLVSLGFIMGSAFTPETGRQIVDQLPAMFISTVISLIVCFWIGWVVHKRTRISLSSATLGSIPGGLSQMVILSEELANADITAVTFMQTVRLLTVVFIVPSVAIYGISGQPASTGLALNAAQLPAVSPDTIIYVAAVAAGTWLAVRLNLPTALLLGSLLGTAPLGLYGFTAPHLPPLAITVSQIALGGYMGYRINPDSLRAAPNLLYWAVFSALGAVLLSLMLGYAIDYVMPLGLTTAFLATAPGGMAEMALTASATNSDVAIVSAYQIFRVLFILFVAPPILRRWFGDAGQMTE